LLEHEDDEDKGTTGRGAPKDRYFCKSKEIQLTQSVLFVSQDLVFASLGTNKSAMLFGKGFSITIIQSGHWGIEDLVLWNPNGVLLITM